MKEKIEEYIGPVLCGIVIGLILGLGVQMSEIDFWFKVHLIWALVVIVIAMFIFIYNMKGKKDEYFNS